MQNPVENTVKGEGRVRLRNRSKLRKIDLKEGVFRGMPVYICTIFVLLAVLFLSVLYAVTVGSADLSMKDVYQVIFYEIFKVGDPEVWGSVYDVRELLDASVKLMDGRSPLEIELPGPLNLVKKTLLKAIKGTLVEKVLRDHDVIKDYMLEK